MAKTLHGDKNQCRGCGEYFKMRLLDDFGG